MDLVSGCKEKLAYFRIKELKDVLTQLGLSKQGRKQDLVGRILAILSDEQVPGMWAKQNAVGKEGVVKIVDDTYRKIQVSGAMELATKGLGVSHSCIVKVKEEIEDSHQMDKICCPCGSSLRTESMIQCQDPRCHAQQHRGCVIIPEVSMEIVQPVPLDIFYCGICRLSRADPFWVTVAHPLYPVKLTIASVPSDGSNPIQSVERSFQITRADKDLLSKQEYDVQAWCMLLNDKVPFRMQWPLHADLKVNGVPMRAINRPGSQLLGANGRDDGPIITPCTRDGINKISLTGCDARVFCLGVRIAKRCTIQQILNLIPKESDGEKFEDALFRVRRCVGGGTATENADSDSDLEVVDDSFTVNLRCPMSGSRMKVAGRFKPCAHIGCFDLEIFVEMNQRSRKWQCPICLKNYSLENIIIDPFFNPITSKMWNCGEDVTEIEVKPDGSWRAKTDNDCCGLGDLGQWHLPDGSLVVPLAVETKLKSEGISEDHPSLKLEIKKNQNGSWEVCKPTDMHILSSGNISLEKVEDHGPNVIPMSSGVSGSGRDGNDPTVNQDGGGNFDFATDSVIELDSISINIDSKYGFPNQVPYASSVNAEVIVLSDSDDDDESLITSGDVYKSNQMDVSVVTFSAPPHGIPDSYPEDPGLVVGGNSYLGVFSNNNDEFGVSLWSLPSSGQGGSGVQFFGSDAEVDVLADMQHGSINCPTLMDEYRSTSENAMGSAAFVPDSDVDHSNADLDDGLVDNPMTFGGEDPSLQLLLPTRPSDATMPACQRNQAADVSSGMLNEDWISLRLQGGGSGGLVHPAATTELNPRHQLSSKEGALDSLADTASLLLSMNDHKSVKPSREISDSPFSFPRQRRSVRPRVYLCIDSDSE